MWVLLWSLQVQVFTPAGHCPELPQGGADWGTWKHSRRSGRVSSSVPKQQLAVTCSPSPSYGFWTQRKAAGSDWEAQLLVTSMEPQGGRQGGGLHPHLRVADHPLKHSHW